MYRRAVCSGEPAQRSERFSQMSNKLREQINVEKVTEKVTEKVNVMKMTVFFVFFSSSVRLNNSTIQNIYKCV